MKNIYTVIVILVLTTNIISQVITLGTFRDSNAPLITEEHVQVYVNDGTESAGHFCRIIPASSSNFTMETRSDYDTMGILYESNGSILSMNEGEGDGGEGEEGDFLINFDLEVGETYYLGLWNNESALDLVVDLYITGGALPVELNFFTASSLNDIVTLNWQTATEVNNYGFSVERSDTPLPPSAVFPSREGKERSDRGVWETIGFVEGNGNSNSTKEYSFTDKDVANGNYSYRLKQIDIDGSFSYSNIVEITCNMQPSTFELYQNYPNPFNPNTVISYQLPVISNVKLKIYDILGNEVATLVNETKEPGVYQVEFDGSNLASGIYLYKLSAGKNTQTKKLLLIK